MCEKETTAVKLVMQSCGMPIWGVAPFAALESALLPCGAKRRLPAGAKSVITTVFPYYVPCAPGEISRYAMSADYHVVAGDRLKKAADTLCAQFESHRFEPFCDASPIPEVTAARLAGLGVLGCNGLLITPRFGSFVFIGEIVTTLQLPPCENPGGTCSACGLCVRHCPSGAITEGGIDRERCVSDITQKKGKLTPEQCLLLQKAGTIWGCDLCQNICPHNQKIETTDIEAFQKNLIDTITEKEINNENFAKDNATRAFMWRGKKVLKRNISILHGAPAYNISEE